ncbi:MAG: Tetratricopeptide (TPR) repeat [Verrucomicrobia bacterium]|nr:MAG: Tetratricopeptide (TPR) repeat [Verrucomicrobiota bacterium]
MANDGSQRLGIAALRLPLAAAVAFALLGGSSPRGAELVPFRGIPVEIAPASPPLGGEALPKDVDSEVESDFRAGALAMGKGELAAAKHTFTTVLQRRPEHLSSLINLGWIAQRTKSWVEAEDYLKRARQLSPDNASIWFALGVVYLEQERVDFALAAFSQVVALEPANARAHRMLGLTLGRKEWYSAAEGELRRSLEIEPSDPGAHFNLAVIYLQRQPVALELARRHYHLSVDLGSAPDPQIAALLSQNIPEQPLPTAAQGVR